MVTLGKKNLLFYFVLVSLIATLPSYVFATGYSLTDEGKIAAEDGHPD